MVPWRRRAAARLALVAALALVASGCRLGVATEVDLAPDGSAVVGIALRLDGSMLVELDRLRLDPTLAIDAALAGDDGWRRTRGIDEDGGLVLRFERAAADPAELALVLSDLSTGVPDEAPALDVALDVVVGEGGALTVDGHAGIRPPTTAGARLGGVPIGPSGDELAAIVERVVDATLTVTLPGPVLEHDADGVDGRTLVWDLPVGAPRDVRAVSGPVPWWAIGRRVPAEVRAVVVVALAIAVLAGVLTVARRRRSAAAAIAGSEAGVAGAGPATATGQGPPVSPAG